ncbi:4'-phosphopantetheinyl transferase superfamily protein [Streptomyces sp. SID8366]|uniref:4'-phosphopantetheinyl transferase family protein n=1 Tax=unclassified Streptomyces TaxID=2593676 RepID=UPI000DB97E83|nr:4'-phosphopantetheinyl transferase superfamily protein [Streptomyces sp. PsTaAH-130]MYU07838.1 4'-phosphopantetheinyl transferase superfamily protein [Streptomyces sp. SID8366]MYU67356.1 4'-phosphopantetheinyl transferase superfamily protein [Streptomyces sp. SID69]RAJ52179.1 4'-phosphopantetheinyl transferase [Streptomyces sp. PsTaAH-130]
MPYGTGALRDPPRVRAFDPAAVTGRRLTPPAPGGPAQLWLLHAGRHRAAVARAAPEVLDAGERARAAALRVPADRECYLAAHLGLRLLLGAYLGVRPARVPLTRRACPLCGGPHGRPGVTGDPLHYSLSYSGGLGLLAFAAVPVGTDVEAVPAPDAVAEAADVLHPRERDELALLPPSARPPAFARAWVRKEAYLKGLGVGLARAPSSLYAGTGAEPAGTEGAWRLTDVPVGRGAAGAVAERVDPEPDGTRDGTVRTAR